MRDWYTCQKLLKRYATFMDRSLNNLHITDLIILEHSWLHVMIISIVWLKCYSTEHIWLIKSVRVSRTPTTLTKILYFVMRYTIQIAGPYVYNNNNNIWPCESSLRSQGAPPLHFILGHYYRKGSIRTQRVELTSLSSCNYEHLHIICLLIYTALCNFIYSP